MKIYYLFIYLKFKIYSTIMIINHHCHLHQQKNKAQK